MICFEKLLCHHRISENLDFYCPFRIQKPILVLPIKKLFFRAAVNLKISRVFANFDRSAEADLKTGFLIQSLVRKF